MTERKPKKHHIFLNLLAVLVILTAASLLLSHFGLTVTRYDVASPRLPESFEGFRIVQLSDLHGMEFGTDNTRLVEKVAAEAPDLIALTGDFLDEGRTEDELQRLSVLLPKLTAIAPVYFVSGNHDWASGALEELAALLERTGCTYLRNRYVTLTRGGESIVLAGVEDPNGWAGQIEPDALCAEADAACPGSFTLLLGHRNYWAARYGDIQADLILCGHSHGGVIRLPFAGGVLGTEHNLFPKYDAGEFPCGRGSVIISRGLGGNGVLLPPRFNNTPELVTVILHTA
jgi:predicted MPP superfamily phosphohydrolase